MKKEQKIEALNLKIYELTQAFNNSHITVTRMAIDNEIKALLVEKKALEKGGHKK
jgi:hypothetical protein